jgi:hypothetical protein
MDLWLSQKYYLPTHMWYRTSLKVYCDQLKPYFSLGEVGELSGLPGYNKQLLKILDSRVSRWTHGIFNSMD